ncbi:hypothetical protein CapIbe_017430 [Capra ibex]
MGERGRFLDRALRHHKAFHVSCPWIFPIFLGSRSGCYPEDLLSTARTASKTETLRDRLADAELGIFRPSD